MRQQPMKAGRDRKHANDIERQTDGHSHRAYARKDDEQTRQVHEEKLDADEAIQFVVSERTNVFE